MINALYHIIEEAVLDGTAAVNIDDQAGATHESQQWGPHAVYGIDPTEQSSGLCRCPQSETPLRRQHALVLTPSMQTGNMQVP